MKQTYIVLLLLLSLSVSAQKIRYTDKRNHWFTKGGTPSLETCGFTHIRTFSGDTVINGYTYRMLTQLGYMDVFGCFGDPGNYDCGFVREDTTAGIVYSIFFGVDTAEHILYNYNLVAGDTINYNSHFTPGNIVDSVMEVDSAVINGVYHKVFLMARSTLYDDSISYHPRFYTIVEGVGSLNAYRHPFNICFEGWEDLVCFYQDTNYISVITPYISCDTIHNTFNTDVTCPTLSITITDKLRPTVKVFPNPATDEINITFDGDRNGGTFTYVYDMNGKVVYNNSDAGIQRSFSINTFSWREGLYLVLVQNKYGVLKKERVLIIR